MSGEQPGDEPWRVGTTWGIHVYQGDKGSPGERPVATFHDPADAQRAVNAVNGAERASGELREVVHRHGIVAFCGTDAACRCDFRWRPVADYEAHVAQELSAYTERRARERAAEEARKTADAWQWKAWFDMPLLVTERIGAAQYVTDWLRARADALTADDRAGT